MVKPLHILSEIVDTSSPISFCGGDPMIHQYGKPTGLIGVIHKGDLLSALHLRLWGNFGESNSFIIYCAIQVDDGYRNKYAQN
jgi:hypothetical protein